MDLTASPTRLSTNGVVILLRRGDMGRREAAGENEMSRSWMWDELVMFRTKLMVFSGSLELFWFL